MFFFFAFYLKTSKQNFVGLWIGLSGRAIAEHLWGFELKRDLVYTFVYLFLAVLLKQIIRLSRLTLNLWWTGVWLWDPDLWSLSAVITSCLTLDLFFDYFWQVLLDSISTWLPLVYRTNVETLWAQFRGLSVTFQLAWRTRNKRHWVTVLYACTTGQRLNNRYGARGGGRGAWYVSIGRCSESPKLPEWGGTTKVTLRVAQIRCSLEMTSVYSSSFLCDTFLHLKLNCLWSHTYCRAFSGPLKSNRTMELKRSEGLLWWLDFSFISLWQMVLEVEKKISCSSSSWLPGKHNDRKDKGCHYICAITPTSHSSVPLSF